MSKKMMKRSLALGALMAFVITGSALAAEESNIKREYIGNETVDSFLPVAFVNDSTAIANSNELTVSGNTQMKCSGAILITRATGDNVTASNNSVRISDNAIIDSSLSVNYLSIKNNQSVGSIISENTTINIEGNAQCNGTIHGVNIPYGSTTKPSIDVNVSNVKIDIKGQAKIADIYGVKINNTSYSNNIYVENVSVNIAGDVVFNGENICGTYIQNLVGQTNTNETHTADANVENSTVNIGGNVVIGSGVTIYGAYLTSGAASSSTASGFTSSDIVANVSGAVVNINGDAVVNGKVYGGYVKTEELTDNVTASGTASGNTINLSENANVSNAQLIGSYTEVVTQKEENSRVEVKVNKDECFDDCLGGGYDEDGTPTPSNTHTEHWKNEWQQTTKPEEKDDTSAENTSNNTLKLSEDWTGGAGGKAINTVGNFDTIKIESADADNPIKIENLNLKQDDDNSNGTAIVVDKLQMESGTKEGESVKLFDTTNSTGDIDEDNSKATVYVGTAEMGTASIGGDLQNNGINLTVQELDMNPQVLVIGESRAAATAFVNQGSELIETGLDALARDNAKAGDTKVFAAVYGNASEYATGSHVKVNGWSGIVGVGKTNDNGLTVGAFFENGDGNYRTYNVNAGTFMRGDGEAVYNGGGLLVRKDNANGVYTEASLRAGNLKNELKNAVMGKAGLDGYDVDTFYYGAHVGIGKVIPRGNEGDSIDVYGKFMYTHHDGETFNIQGDDYKFDSVYSERLRLGFRINEVQTSKLSMYYGAAWEYEFGGDADNKVVGYDLSTPSLGGSTMIGEVGMHYLASEKWSLDLNVRGYSGQRDGFTGSVQANYSF